MSILVKRPYSSCLRILAAAMGLWLVAASPAAAQLEHEHPEQDEGGQQAISTATTSGDSASSMGLTNRERFRIPAIRVERGPVIDGVLDDEVWQNAAVIEEFVQQEPREGATATERTEVRVLYDGENLYVGVRAFDADPSRIMATEMRRDGTQILNEDNFQIILDTFMDSRSAYHFVITPLGAKLDQQVFDEGEGGRRGGGSNINLDWDGVWETSARRTSEGWSAEIRIPMVTLRFPDAEQQSWGINFMRNIAHKNEVVFWAPIPRVFDIMRVSQAGSLDGLEDLNRGRDLRLKPFAIVGGSAERAPGVSQHSGQGDVGLDVKYGIAAGLNLDLTFNTDFAQAEADDERVNLTRFALFFPEKRDFFIENSGQFNVGTTASSNRNVDLFFSRRIGINEDGNHVPILAGARLTGKVGQHNIAVMDIQTDEAFGAPGENFFVARYSRDLLTRSRVGGMVINKQATRGGHYNRTFATDASFSVGQDLTLSGFVARTASPGLSDENLGGHVLISWLNPSWYVYLDHVNLQENFNAEVGFVPRGGGMRFTKFHVERTPRPGRWGIRVMNPMWNITYVTDQMGRMVERRFHHMVAVGFDNGSRIDVRHNRQFERLDVPFRVRSGISIQPGDYNFHDSYFGYSSSASRRVSYGISYAPQTYYDGDRTDISLQLGSRITSQLSTALRYSRNDVDLPAGDFVAEVGSLQVDYTMSPELSFRSLSQYNSLTKQWSTAARLRYTYRPGSELYVVYDELRRDVRGIPVVEEYRDRQLIVKMTYLLSY